eukprot:UN23350
MEVKRNLTLKKSQLNSFKTDVIKYQAEYDTYEDAFQVWKKNHGSTSVWQFQKYASSQGIMSWHQFGHVGAYKDAINAIPKLEKAIPRIEKELGILEDSDVPRKIKEWKKHCHKGFVKMNEHKGTKLASSIRWITGILEESKDHRIIALSQFGHALMAIKNELQKRGIHSRRLMGNVHVRNLAVGSFMGNKIKKSKKTKKKDKKS